MPLRLTEAEAIRKGYIPDPGAGTAPVADAAAVAKWKAYGCLFFILGLQAGCCACVFGVGR